MFHAEHISSDISEYFIKGILISVYIT